MNIISARHALLKAMMHVITETAVQQNAHNTSTLASSAGGVLMIMPNVFQFTGTQFYNFGVHINNVCHTSIPVIFNGNSAEDVINKTKMYAYENNGISIYNIDIATFEDQVMSRYEEITGEMFSLSFNTVMNLPPGQKVLTLLQDAVAEEFATLANYISYAMGTPSLCTQAVGKMGPAMYQQNRFYESLSGIGFKIQAI